MLLRIFLTDYITTYILHMHNTMVVVTGMANRLDLLGGKGDRETGENCM